MNRASQISQITEVLPEFKALLIIVLSNDCVTIDLYWTDDRIYWTLDTVCDYNLQFTITHTDTVIHSYDVTAVAW
jgi:hypothetical protein